MQDVTAKVRNIHAIGPAIDAFQTLYRCAETVNVLERSGAEFAHCLAVMSKEMDAMWGYLECRKVDDSAAQAKIRKFE